MRLLIIQIMLCLQLLSPMSVMAQSVSPKDPLSYPLKTYGFMLIMAIFGGFVSWYAKVRRNEIPGSSLFHLIGEITTSAFAGLVTFFICEYAGLPQVITAPLVGIAGHMGAKIIGWYEERAAKTLSKKAEVLND